VLYFITVIYNLKDMYNNADNINFKLKNNNVKTGVKF